MRSVCYGMRKDCILPLGKDFQISPNKTPVFLQGDRDVEKVVFE